MHCPSTRFLNELGGAEVNQLFAALFQGLVSRFRARSGKARIAEKTPNNVFYFQRLHMIFPRSPLVHAVRDGRDGVASLLGMDGESSARAVQEPIYARAVGRWRRDLDDRQRARRRRRSRAPS